MSYNYDKRQYKQFYSTTKLIEIHDISKLNKYQVNLYNVCYSIMLFQVFMIYFSHNDAIQCLSYNPVSHQLASCACTDFGKHSFKCKKQNFSVIEKKFNSFAFLVLTF